MHDIKERLSLFWLFALLNYLYADVLALFAFVGSPTTAPRLPQWALLGSAVLMDIPIAMVLACRLLPFRANRLANIVSSSVSPFLRPVTSSCRATGRDSQAAASWTNFAAAGWSRPCRVFPPG